MGRGDYQDPRARQRAAPWAVAALLCASAPAATSLAQPAGVDVVLRIHAAVAEDGEGGRVADAEWLAAQVAQANRIFAPASVAFVLEEARAMPASHGQLEDRRARHALGALLRDRVINWFVVRSLRDVDDPARLRMGVHWRPAGLPGKHFVIVVAGASDDVLAHELGHFFGNAHSDVPGNVMSYARDPARALSFFDDAQLRRIRRSVRRFLQTRELVP